MIVSPFGKQTIFKNSPINLSSKDHKDFLFLKDFKKI